MVYELDFKARVLCERVLVPFRYRSFINGRGKSQYVKLSATLLLDAVIVTTRARKSNPLTTVLENIALLISAHRYRGQHAQCQRS